MIIAVSQIYLNFITVVSSCVNSFKLDYLYMNNIFNNTFSITIVTKYDIIVAKKMDKMLQVNSNGHLYL